MVSFLISIKRSRYGKHTYEQLLDEVVGSSRELVVERLLLSDVDLESCLDLSFKHRREERMK